MNVRMQRTERLEKRHTDSWNCRVSIRKKVPYTPMHELLWEIYDRTGLFDYIQAGASGEQQKANLLMLLQKARDYESTSYRGLFTLYGI